MTDALDAALKAADAAEAEIAAWEKLSPVRQSKIREIRHRAAAIQREVESFGLHLNDPQAGETLNRFANTPIAQLPAKDDDPALKWLDAFETELDANRPLRTVSAASFADKAAPEREELVSGLIPAKIIGGLYGDGAVGKSLLAMQLGICVVAGRLWLNRIVRKGPVLYVCCEDDEAEVHRRLENICREMNVDMATLRDFHILPLADEISVLAMADSRSSVLTPTPLYNKLVGLTKTIKPQLLLLDTLNDIFAGSQNDPMQAKQFVKLLRPLVIPHGGTGLVLAHPSVDGMRSGSGSSGTVGWNNSFRWRGYLDKILDESGREPDATRRVLRTKKLNYGPQGGEIELRYQSGCYVVADGQGVTLDPMWKQSRADRCFMDLLRKGIDQNNRVSVQERGGCYAPKVFRSEANKQGVTYAELKEAMHRLLDSNKIENVPFGALSRAAFRLQPALHPPQDGA
jgi:RecA-family ATPase